MPYREMRIRTLTPAVSALAAGATALALAVGASGCGSSATTTFDPLANAAEVTSQTGGAHLALSARISGAGLPSQPASGGITLTGGGYFNYRTHEGTMSITIAGLPQNAATGSSLGMEEIFKGTAVYVGSPLFAGKLPGGAHWMKIDLARAGQAAGLSPAQLLGGQSNPAQFLEYLKASGGTVHAVGSDSVRGVPTTHYQGTIDLRKAASVLGGAGGGAVRSQVEKSISQIGLSSLPVDVWVDSHKMVRRLEFAISAPTGGQQVQVRLNVELFDFGATPAVNAPASGETFDATSSALSGLSSLGG